VKICAKQRNSSGVYDIWKLLIAGAMDFESLLEKYYKFLLAATVSYDAILVVLHFSRSGNNAFLPAGELPKPA
jgi:hypothetical protein